MADDGQSDRSARQKLVSRAVYGSFLGLATAFILSSAGQLLVAVFGLGTAPLAPESAPQTGSACAQGIARLATALDRSLARAALPDLEEGRVSKAGPEAGGQGQGELESFRKDLGPEWARAGDVEATCAGEPRGRDAFAALLRLKLAEEGFVLRQMVEIDPLRRDVQAYLPH